MPYSGAKAVMPFSFSKKPGVGSLLLKATALIEAIRTVKWPARCDRSLNGAELTMRFTSPPMSRGTTPPRAPESDCVWKMTGQLRNHNLPP